MHPWSVCTAEEEKNAANNGLAAWYRQDARRALRGKGGRGWRRRRERGAQASRVQHLFGNFRRFCPTSTRAKGADQPPQRGFRKKEKEEKEDGRRNGEERTPRRAMETCQESRRPEAFLIRLFSASTSRQHQAQALLVFNLLLHFHRDVLSPSFFLSVSPFVSSFVRVINHSLWKARLPSLCLYTLGLVSPSREKREASF